MKENSRKQDDSSGCTTKEGSRSGKAGRKRWADHKGYEGFRKIRILTLKEIRDILRDKKTLVTMVLIPLLLYPAMIIGVTLIMSSMIKEEGSRTYRVLYERQTEGIEAVIEELERISSEMEDGNDSLEFIPFTESPVKADSGDLSEDEAESKKQETWEAILQDQGDVLLRIRQADGNDRIILEYNSTENNSDHAADLIRDIVKIYEDEAVENRLQEQGLTMDFLSPVIFEEKDLVTHSEAMGVSLGSSLGMMLILTIMMGVFYPVIDVVTGEKERGTLETLLTLPVTNFQMIMSKFLAVAGFACLTAVLSILSLGGSIFFLVKVAAGAAGEKSLGMDPGLLLSGIPLLLAVVLITALLLTAVSMCFCIFAKSFKEANNYITPVMLIVMFASMIPMIPGIELDYRTALVPIANVCLLVRDMAAQRMDFGLAGTIMAVNLGYSVLTIWILSRIYHSENVLFRDGFQSFSLFEKRSDIRKGSIPKTGDLILIVTVLVLLILYLGTAGSAVSMMTGAIVNQLLILILPLVVVWYMKTEWKQLFSFRLPGWKQAVGGVLLYIGTFCLTILTSSIIAQWFPQSTEQLEQSFTILMEASLPLLILVICLMPALGEEIFFRGLLFGSWRHRLGPVPALILSSLVFGAFHMSLVKLIPTALLGACFAYITWKSGSIYPGMVLHFLNNLFSLIAMKYPEQMARTLPVLTQELGIGSAAIVAAAGIIGLILGYILLRGGRGQEKSKS